MLRKILFFSLSILIVFSGTVSVLSVNAFAFSCSDLSSYGVPTMEVYRCDATVCDGVISSAEYGSSVNFQKGSGLYVLRNGRALQDDPVLSQSRQESFVALNGDSVYCAFRLSVADDEIQSVVKGSEEYYCISFYLGLTPGEHPALRGSLLSNHYYFSPQDLSCKGFAGERRARSVTEASSFSKPLSSFVPNYESNGIVTSDGVLWNAEQYCKNAVLSIERFGETTTLTAEVRIPLEDVLLSVHPSQRDHVRNTLFNQSETLCGSFYTSVNLNSADYIVTGLPTDLPAPNSENSESLASYLERSFEAPTSGVYIPEVLPISLYWSGKPIQQSVSLPTAEEAASSVVPDHKEISSVSQTNSVPSVSSASDVLTDDPVTENDESVFDSLPDQDAFLPEDTEIVYDKEDTSQSKESDKSENDFSLASSILATVTGAFLFASIMALCIYFRKDRQKAEEQNKKPKNKKNDQKSKERNKNRNYNTHYKKSDKK